MSRPAKPKPGALAPGDLVKTPTGRRAVVVRTDDRLHEATVKYEPELAHFRVSKLQRSETEGGG